MFGTPIADGESTGPVVVTPGSHTLEEVSAEGWTLTGASCVDEEQQQVGSQEGLPYYLTLEKGDDVTCTFTNTKNEVPVENSCLEPSVEGDESTLTIGTSAEETLQQILDAHAYGVNATTDETRIQTWGFSADSVTFTVTVLQKHAGNTQTFGYYKAGDTSSFTPVFTIPPTTLNSTFTVTVPSSFANFIGFAIQTSGTQSNTWYSEKALNTDGKDNVAVYNPDNNVYVVAFEDLKNGDNDYNDLVVEVSGIECTTNTTSCSVTMVSGTDENEDGSDDYTTVVEKSGALAKLLSFIHSGWTATIAGASWIWGDDPVAAPVNGVTQTFERAFNWHGPVTSATLTVAADNSYTVDMNANSVGGDAEEFNYKAGHEDTYDVTSLITEGANVLSTAVYNMPSSADPAANPAGLLYKLEVTGTDPNCSSEEVVDVCPNLEGNQSVVPENLIKDEAGNCVEPSQPPVDVCPNLEGTQTEVPSGYTKNTDGQCVQNGGGSSSHHHHHSSNNTPSGEVEGATDTRDGAAQVTAVPMVAGANTGAGGSQNPMQTLPFVALAAMIGSLAIIRKTSDVR